MTLTAALLGRIVVIQHDRRVPASAGAHLFGAHLFSALTNINKGSN